MSNNVNNPTKVITGSNTRWSYCNAWEAKAIQGGTPKFSVSLIIPKSDKKTIAKIEEAIKAAYREGEAKLKGNGRSVPALSVLKTALRLPASWMRTGSRSSTIPRCTAACTAGRASISTLSTAMVIRVSPAG